MNPMKPSFNNRWQIVNKVFLDNFTVACLIELSQVGAGFIDGIITSRMLSGDAMASFGIAQPIFSFLAIFFGLFATGMQTMTSQELGKCNIKDCNRLFCAAFYLSGIFSLFAMACVLLLANPIAMLLGATGSGAHLQAGAADYIRGLGFGVPAVILNAVLSPAIQMDSGRKRVLTSVVIDAVIDIILDFVAVSMGMGLFGIGLATTIGRYIRLVIQLLHFRNKTHFLHFVPLKTSVREMIHMLSFGTEKAWRRFGNVLRPVFINKLILFYGGAAAMTAMSIRGNISDLTEVLAVGLADTVGLLTGIYYGEKNEEAQKHLGKSVHRSCALFCGTAAVIFLILAYPIAKFYTRESSDITSLAHLAIIGVALQCPLQALVRSRITYLQRIQKTKSMQLVIMLSTVVYPILSALGLGMLFGVYGVLLCYLVGDFMTLFTIWIYYAVTKRRFRPSAQDYLNLPDDFHINPGDIISLDIRNMEDVSLAAEQLSMFCRGHKLSSKVGNRAAVCLEEMAANTVTHGFPLNKSKTPIIDLRVIITSHRLIIRLQDNCPKFDVGSRFTTLAEADQQEKMSNLGIWLTQNLADETRYVYSFETNTIFMEFNIDRE